MKKESKKQIDMYDIEEGLPLMNVIEKSEFIQYQYLGTVKFLFQCSKFSTALAFGKEIKKSGSTVELYAKGNERSSRNLYGFV